MDGSTFDGFARWVSARPSRRIMLGALLAAIVPRVAAAQCVPNPFFCQDEARCDAAVDNCGREINCGQCPQYQCIFSACDAGYCGAHGPWPDGAACTNDAGVHGHCCDGDCITGVCP
jgi:hypothetical protein